MISRQRPSSSPACESRTFLEEKVSWSQSRCSTTEMKDLSYRTNKFWWPFQPYWCTMMMFASSFWRPNFQPSIESGARGKLGRYLFIQRLELCTQCAKDRRRRARIMNSLKSKAFPWQFVQHEPWNGVSISSRNRVNGMRRARKRKLPSSFIRDSKNISWLAAAAAGQLPSWMLWRQTGANARLPPQWGSGLKDFFHSISATRVA